MLNDEPDEIRRGLWRWTTPHPEWQPADQDGTPASWPREVGCVLYETASHAVFIDPLVGEDERAFWAWADERCDGREVAVLETIAFHRRSRERLLERYGATTAAPASVTACPIAGAQETIFWIAEHRALVPGDTLIATGAGELSLCPPSWLEFLAATPTVRALRDALAPLLDLDAELVLVSHGEPVLRDGRAALARALREP